MTLDQRPLPMPTATTEGYWDAAAENRLVVQECASCGCRQFYPRDFCTSCLSEDVRWHTCCGMGSIYTFTINHRAPNAFMKERTPYAVAVVELDEGVRMLANIVDSPLSDIAIGSRVRVVFEKVTDELTLPQFTLVAARSSS